MVLLSLFWTVTVVSCSGKTKENKDLELDKSMARENRVRFNADSAFSFIESQVSFGPRVPGTQEHSSCSEWLVEKLKSYTDTVFIQSGNVTAFNGDKLNIMNIFGQINAEKPNRLLLLAHYDTRPWADAESDPKLRDIPISGSNDGASGVAAILELARVLKSNGYNGGIDFLFVDAEDYGVPEHSNYTNIEDSWCLGTQMWVKEYVETKNYRPAFAILLDMVGGYNAQFHKEYFSQMYAPSLNDAIWATAAKSGYSDYFINETGNPITDDHIYLIKSSIPAVDIIENKNQTTGSFNPTWHTHEDSIDNIDIQTLGAVGSTLQDFITNL